MTPDELRTLVSDADIYKMSLGKKALYRAEAIKCGALVFISEKRFYEAVVSGDEANITKYGRLIKTDQYPLGGAPENAHSVWRGGITTFRTLPRNSLVLHWEAGTDHLYWGLTEEIFSLDREEVTHGSQIELVFHRPLAGGWHDSSIGGIPLSNLHPKARDLAVNQATINRVQTDADYFRYLILDGDVSAWEKRNEWKKRAQAAGWHPKDLAAIRAARSNAATRPLVKEITDYFMEEIERMADTAIKTVAYANGQTAVVSVKVKNSDFTKAQLENEIHALLKQQKYCCALSGYKFRENQTNPHLRPSLDRKDSSLGYVAGNLQIVTRAANFFKSASDDKDWELKAAAIERMAIAMQQRRKAADSGQS